MPSGYTIQGTDLDSVFKKRHTLKRQDTGFKDLNGSDISNRYEKLNSYKVRITTNSTAETYERYGRNNDGTLLVILEIIYPYPDAAELIGAEISFNYTVSFGNISQTIVSNSKGEQFYFTGLNQDTYSVVVTENTSGRNSTVSVGLGSATAEYYLNDLTDQLRANTGFVSFGRDLRYLFTSIRHIKLEFTISSTAETPERYGRKNDGTLTVDISDAYYNPYNPLSSGAQHNYTVSVGSISKTILFDGSDAQFKFTGLNQGTYSIVVIENISGKRVTVATTLGDAVKSYNLIAS